MSKFLVLLEREMSPVLCVKPEVPKQVSVWLLLMPNGVSGLKLLSAAYLCIAA